MTKLEMIDAIILYMKSDDGYLEKKTADSKYLYTKLQNAGYNNYTKYWDIIKKTTGLNYQGGAWCMGSIFAIHIETLGLEAAQTLFYQKAAINCQATYEIFREHSQVYSTPEVGDMIVFWNGSRMHHVEYVIRVSSDTFWTWGGNTSSDSSIVVDNGGAARYGKQYSVKSCKAAGHKFLRPDYNRIATAPQNATKCSGKLTVVGMLNCRQAPVDGKQITVYLTNTVVDVTNYTFAGGAYWFKTKDGWVSGNYLKGWVEVDTTDEHNRWWYMTGSKVSKSSYYIDTIQEINGAWYLFKPNGYALQDDWYKKDDSWYYAYDNCQIIRNNWLDYNGASYYFDSNGVMVTDTYVKSKDGTVEYYLAGDGKWDSTKTRPTGYNK